MSIRTLDLFCGAGGSSWGAVKAGADIVMGVDGWERAIETYSQNHYGRGKHQLMTPRTRPSDLGLKRHKIDLLLASPECTNHTCAKGAVERCEDSKLTANYVLNFAKDLEPRWIVIENVVHMKQWLGFDPLIKKLTKLGYGCRVQTLDASDFGVPQTRRRMFIMASREAVPEPLVIPDRPIVSAMDILDYDIDRDSDRHVSREFYPGRAEPTIQRFHRGIEALGKYNPFLIVYYGSDAAGGWQALDRPLRTITTLDRFGLVTWRGRTPFFRMLQPSELRRAMGFLDSDSYVITGNRREQIKQLGNGVCPPVMEAIVRHLTQ